MLQFIITIKDTCIFQNQFLFQITFIKIKSTKICLYQFSKVLLKKLE